MADKGFTSETSSSVSPSYNMKDWSELLAGFGDRVLEGYYENLSNEGLGDSNLAKSLSYEIDTNRIIVSAAHYWDYAAHGRGPGGTPYNFIDILVTWMRKYGVQPKNGNERSFAWAIKKKMEFEGSSIYRGDRPDRDFETDVYERNVAWLEDQVAQVTIEKYVQIMP